MEGQRLALHPALVERGDQPVGEMQRRGRRRHRTGFAREHGLIVVAVGLVRRPLAGDIGRQRHLPGPLEQQLDGLVAHGSGAGSRLPRRARPRWPSRPRRNSMTSPSRTRLALRTNAHHSRRPSRLCSVAPTRASPRLPSSWAGMTRVSLNTSTSPGRRMSGRSSTLRSDSARALDQQHARRIARARGAKGDAIGRKVEVEKVDAHYCGVGRLLRRGFRQPAREPRPPVQPARARAPRPQERAFRPPLRPARAREPRPQERRFGRRRRHRTRRRRSAGAAAAGVAAGAGAAATTGGAGSGPPIVARTILVGCGRRLADRDAVDRRHALDHPAEGAVFVIQLEASARA